MKRMKILVAALAIIAGSICFAAFTPKHAPSNSSQKVFADVYFEFNGLYGQGIADAYDPITSTAFAAFTGNPNFAAVTFNTTTYPLTLDGKVPSAVLTILSGYTPPTGGSATHTVILDNGNITCVNKN